MTLMQKLTEPKIHLAAREHALLACASWLIAWEAECAVNSQNARFCLERALISAHVAEDNLSEANLAAGKVEAALELRGGAA
jgi:hypothetical protein